MSRYDSGLTPSNYAIKDVTPGAVDQERPEDAKNMPTSSGVGTPTRSYNEMYARWELPLNLMGGTLAMREAERKYLPQEPGEENHLYESRLVRTVLYGIYSRTIKSLSAIPFIDPIILKSVPGSLSYLAETCTDDGRTLREMAQDLMEDNLNLGLSHFLVDFPYIPDSENMSLAEERALGARPFFVPISPTNLIGWIIDSEGLAEIRIYYKDTVQGLDYSEKLQERVRVINRTSFTDYVKTASKGGSKEKPLWISQGSKANPLGYIPLVTCYGDNDGAPLTGKPVLEELAWINLKHYQKQSDVDNIEHVANTPFLFATGFAADELEDVVVGVNTLITSSKDTADIRYVEHTGAAIGVSQNSIKKLEERAAVMGAEFLSQAATNRQTAYSKSVDTGRSLSILQAIVNNLSDALRKGYIIALDWMGESLPEDLSITIGEGIDLSLDNNDLMALVDMAREGILSIEDLQYELQRRGKISDSTELSEPKREPSQTVQEDSRNENIGESDDT